MEKKKTSGMLAKKIAAAPILFTLIFILFSTTSFAQKKQDHEGEVLASLKELHQAFIKKDTATINKLTNNKLNYIHSSGVVETKSEMLKSINTGSVVYESYKEDSITVVVSHKVAYARFIANIKAGPKESAPNKYHLSVLEVWEKGDKNWKLLVRQSVKK